MTRFQHAIVKPPCSSFADGLTTAEMGIPDLDLAQEQHNAYCAALERCGVNLTILEPDPQFPDSTFVEDTVVLTSRSAILTHPGEASRQGNRIRVKSVLTDMPPTMTVASPR